MRTFGYRGRLFEGLYLPTNIPDYQKKDLGVKKEMARWILKRYKQLHPQKPVPEALRFVAGIYNVKKDFPPRGHWQKPEWESFDKKDTYIIYTHDVREE